MKRRVIAALLVCIVELLGPLPCSAVSAREVVLSSAIATLDYRLTIGTESALRHIAHVTLNATNLNTYELTLTMHEFLGGFFPIPIINLLASNEKGTALRVTQSRTSHPYGDERFWRITADYARHVQVEYDVALNFSRSEGDSVLERQYKGYIGKEFGVSVAAWTFLVPTEITVNNIHVQLDLPGGWISATPWQKSPDGYTVESVDDLVTSTYAVGRFDVRTREIAGTKVSIAVYGDWSGNLRDQMADSFFKLFEYMVSLFVGSPLPVYLAICHPPTEDRGEVRGEWSQSQSLVILESYDIADVAGALAHALFHCWNLFPPLGMQQKSNEESWFREGTNIYYQWDKALIKIGLLSGNSVLASYDYPTYIKEYVGTKYDVPVTEAYQFDNPQESDKLSFLVYRKGALVSFLLDQTVQKLTGGNRSLDDLVEAMYQKYGGQGYDGRYWASFYSEAGYSNLDMIKFLDRVTGFDLKPFFDNYVYGKDRLPLKIVAGDLAVDWPELLRALRLSRFPIMTLTLSDDFPKVGQTVSMTAQLVTMDSKPIVNQTITFYLNSTLIGSGTTDQSGLAILTFKVEVDRGTYQVVANYAGSPLFSGTKESAALTVLPMEVTVTSTAGPTSTTQVATETSVLPVQMTWLQVHWPYLVLALMVAAIAVVFVGRRLRSRP